MSSLKSSLLRLAAVALAGCTTDSATSGTTPLNLTLPLGLPQPPVPSDNPLTVEGVELGRHLFYDLRLSGNGQQACASCHLQDKGFADGKKVSEGSTGESTPRNSMGLTNVAYNTTLTWANPALKTLEQQIKVPMFGEFPIELGITGNEETVLQRFRDDPDMAARFAAAFPDDPDPIDFDNVVKALASFVRTIVSGDTPYDRYVYGGDASALSDSAKRGLDLFFSEKAECFHCHGGFNLSGASTHTGVTLNESSFFNNGLYNVDGMGSYPAANTGLFEFTKKADDMGRFRVPTLRNVTLTAPYMHDGSIATLEDVVRFYEAGGRLIESGENAGDGRTNPYKSQFVPGFTLTDQERADLLAFLESLTDPTLATNPAFKGPSPND
jgi:cytochrome c peroxidase